MTRVCSQLTFCSPQKILRNTVVEQDENQVITRLFCLDDSPVESSQTLFYDGILSSGIVSVKHNISTEEIGKRARDFQYIDVSEVLPAGEIKPDLKPFILDFGDNTPDEINRKLAGLAPALASFSVYELIAACTFNPAIMLGIPGGLIENHCSTLLLWEGADLVNKRISDHTSIRIIKR